MKFSELVKGTEDIWQKLINHPFIIEIYRGNLSQERFKFYLLQDYYYLGQSLRNMSLLAARAEDLATRREMIDILHMESVGEFAAYEDLLQSLGIDLKEAEQISLTRANVSYTNYLLSISSLGNFMEGLAGFLPCYWSYLKIAEVHQSKLASNNNKYYKDWAEYYTTTEYRELVYKMEGLFNKSCVLTRGEKTGAKKLIEVFSTSLKYEYEFWENIYQMEEW
jgi:thiaminase (transcriptional activator TenA)